MVGCPDDHNGDNINGSSSASYNTRLGAAPAGCSATSAAGSAGCSTALPSRWAVAPTSASAALPHSARLDPHATAAAAAVLALRAKTLSGRGIVRDARPVLEL
jgi:hypothetical protein